MGAKVYRYQTGTTQEDFDEARDSKVPVLIDVKIENKRPPGRSHDLDKKYGKEAVDAFKKGMK